MPKPIPPHFRPSESYWTELYQCDAALYDVAHNRQGDWVRMKANDRWTRVTDADPASTINDRYLSVRWEGSKWLGGRSLKGAVRMTRFLVDGPLREQTVIPTIEKLFLYRRYLIAPHIPGNAMTYTFGHEFDMRDDNEEVSRALQRAAMHDVATAAYDAYDQGMLFPTSDDYDELLEEMRFGASGGGRFRSEAPAD